MNEESIIVDKKSIFYRIGMGMLIVSLLMWLVPLIAPFTAYSTEEKVKIVAGAIAFAEVMFLGAVLLAGKEAVKKFKSYLIPLKWQKKKE